MSLKALLHVFNLPCTPRRRGDPPGLSGGKRLVLLALADTANDSGICWPSVRVAARKSALSIRHTRALIADLEAEGWIQVMRRTGRSSKYRISCLDTDAQTTASGGGANISPPFEEGAQISGGGEPRITPPLNPTAGRTLLEPVPNPKSSSFSPYRIPDWVVPGTPALWRNPATKSLMEVEIFQADDGSLRFLPDVTLPRYLALRVAGEMPRLRPVEQAEPVAS